MWGVTDCWFAIAVNELWWHGPGDVDGRIRYPDVHTHS